MAREDEQSAVLLHQAGSYRQAIYLYVQAMEKTIRARIFMLVSPTTRYFRDENRHHSIEESLGFLLQVVGLQPLMAEQVRAMCDRYVIGGIEFARLHNNLRYPYFTERFQTYSCLDVDEADAVRIADALRYLQMLIRDLDRFR